ncbi:MAG: 4-hydroxy-tetrahydrodipicolinate synthase [Firmicutes bacterium]|nr:4-hydroxy-tetrahydrodipicolinate synthase [Bacillota bacterium]
MNKTIFEGIAPALVTPFKNGEVDYVSLEKIVDFQIKSGTKNLVLFGTTAEAPTLTFEEEDKIFELVKKRVSKDVKLIVGTGCNDTLTVIRRSIDAKSMGADGLLIVTPYFNKCTQKGLIRHYTQVIEAAKIPVIIYNSPGSTGINIEPETALELSKNPYVAGIKESSGNIEHILKLFHVLDGKMAIYSGDDELDYLMFSLGALGALSVTANIAPKQKQELFDLVKKGEHKKALEIHKKMYELNNRLFIEINPIPLKAALKHMGLCDDELRMPLTRIEEDNRKLLIETLEGSNIK